MTKHKRMSDEERRASYDRASAISDRLERQLGYRGTLADYQKRRVEVSYEVMEQLLDAHEAAWLAMGALGAPTGSRSGKASLKRCPAVSPAPERFRCGLWDGHEGHHSALIPTGVPWDPGPAGAAARAREGR